ncbi:hypothetical protein V6N13_132027 [Hibiscus sabdariffa]
MLSFCRYQTNCSIWCRGATCLISTSTKQCWQHPYFQLCINQIGCLNNVVNGTVSCDYGGISNCILRRVLAHIPKQPRGIPLPAKPLQSLQPQSKCSEDKHAVTLDGTRNIFVLWSESSNYTNCLRSNSNYNRNYSFNNGFSGSDPPNLIASIALSFKIVTSSIPSNTLSKSQITNKKWSIGIASNSAAMKEHFLEGYRESSVMAVIDHRIIVSNRADIGANHVEPPIGSHSIGCDKGDGACPLFSKRTAPHPIYFKA